MARGCSSCGTPRPRGATFCGRCGARLATPRRVGAGAGVDAGPTTVARLRVRPLPTTVVAAVVVVLAIGLRAEPVAGPVRTPEARGAADATAEVERLPVLRACVDAPPPCSSPSTEPTATVVGPLSLRLEQHRLTRVAEDGRDTWSLGLTGPAVTAPGPADGIVVAERGGRLRLVDAASGAVRWERRLAVATGWDLAVAGDERSIAVLATPPTDGAPRVVRVMGISPRDGEVAWMHLANTRAPRPTTAVTGDVVVLSGVLGEAVVSALDRSTGLLRWQVDLGGPVAVLADRQRVAAVTDERLVVIDPDSGRRLLDVRTVGRITGLLAVSATGLVIDTEDGPMTVALPDT